MFRILGFVTAVVLFAGLTPTLVQGAGAELVLENADAMLTQTSDTVWELSKEGSLDPDTSTVTWTIEATKEPTCALHLLIQGAFDLHNYGDRPATIGNIVVNLQTRTGNKWLTVSSNIADATYGDGATSAAVVAKASSEGLSSFSENNASGHLWFTDLGTDNPFFLVPQVSIAPGATLCLTFATAFDNNELHLAAGTLVRVEILVSFGNVAPKSAASSPNVDINGNGSIDADEAWVRTVPARITLTVPAPTPSGATVTLTDTLDDITTTGTVTFTNAVFNLGATSGTVTATVNGGATGGTITNCAHLTGSGGPGVTAIALEDCDTQPIPARPRWQTGDMVTYGQTAWGTPTSAAGAILNANFSTLYGASFVVGGNFTITFSNAGALFAFLPDGNIAGVLTSNLLDPTSTPAGEFAGEVVALQLNVDFSAAGLLSSVAPLGDLHFCNTSITALNGLTVEEFLGHANARLGGGSSPFTLSQSITIARAVNTAFAGGTPSSFAQASLVNGPCTN